MVGNRQEYEAMNACEKELWWYKNLHNNVLKALEKKFGANKEIKIIDAGCGTGGLMEFLALKGYTNVSGIDLSSDAIEFCKLKGLNVEEKDILNVSQGVSEESFDALISNDILCYFSESYNQMEVISQFYKILKPSGICILNLPALKVFFGTHDIAVGIRHRFGFHETKEMITSVGFSINSMFFWPFLVSPLILFVRIWQRISNSIFPKENIVSDVSIPSSLINRILFKLTFLEARLPFRRFFGSSLFIIAEKS